MRYPTRTAFAALAAALLLTVACGNDSDSDNADAVEETPAATGEFPAEVTADNGTVTIESRPERIVSLSPVHTEMLFAIGADDQVEAVDSLSDFPEDAPTTDLSGYEPNVEAVVGYDPDLVVITYDANDLTAGLEALDVPVVELGSAGSLDQSYEQITLLGDATGNAEGADDVITGMQNDIDDLVAGIDDRPEPLTFFHEIDGELYTATSDTFIGSVYALAGLENIADEADDGSGYPQVSDELVLDADPDLIFLSDSSGGADAETIAARPGWDSLSAVRSDRVIELDPNVSSRWGPRTVDFLQTIIDATADIEPVATP